MRIERMCIATRWLKYYLCLIRLALSLCFYRALRTPWLNKALFKKMSRSDTSPQSTILNPQSFSTLEAQRFRLSTHSERDRKIFKYFILIASITFLANVFGETYPTYVDACPLTPGQVVADSWQYLPFTDPLPCDAFSFKQASITQLGMTGYHVTCLLTCPDNKKGFLSKSSRFPIMPAPESKWSKPTPTTQACESSSIVDCRFLMPQS